MRNLSHLIVVAAIGFSAVSAMADGASDYRALHVRAIDLALAGDTKSAIQVLHNLQTEKLSSTQKDEIEMSIARIKYQAGDFTGAIEDYRKVTSGTDLWFTSLEERAWSYMRLEQPEPALAQLKTLLTPLFKEKATSEAYFLSGLAHLRVCDYSAMFKDLDLFKERFRAKVKDWEASSDPKAKKELAGVKETIQKLNVVEAEAIQRLYMDDSLKSMHGRAPKIGKRSDELSFPISADNKEVWLDEVDHYQVRVSGCPKGPNETNKL